MKKHPHLDTIRAYYQGCSTGDFEIMRSTFAPNVTHYFTNMACVSGADNLANFWLKDNTGDRQTVWTVDHGVVDGDEAVIEWTMIVTFGDGRPQEILRGAEWYQFQEGKIAEIRAYYHWSPDQRECELYNFPYAERGYPTLNDGT